MKFKKLAALVLIGSMMLAVAGCGHKEIDVSALPDIDENDFEDALAAIDMSEDDYSVDEDSSFSFTNDSSVYYDYDVCIDAYSDNCYYSYVDCIDEDTAAALYSYYEDMYSDVLEENGGKFSGYMNSKNEDGNGCIDLDGEFEEDDTYSVYHDLIILKGDKVIIAYVDINDEDDIHSSKAEVDSFLDALGYPNP